MRTLVYISKPLRKEKDLSIIIQKNPKKNSLPQKSSNRATRFKKQEFFF